MNKTAQYILLIATGLATTPGIAAAEPGLLKAACGAKNEAVAFELSNPTDDLYFSEIRFSGNDLDFRIRVAVPPKAKSFIGCSADEPFLRTSAQAIQNTKQQKRALSAADYITKIVVPQSAMRCGAFRNLPTCRFVYFQNSHPSKIVKCDLRSTGNVGSQPVLALSLPVRGMPVLAGSVTQEADDLSCDSPQFE